MEINEATFKMLSRLLKSSHITAWLLPHIPLALLYEKQTWDPQRNRSQEPAPGRSPRRWNRSQRSARFRLAHAGNKLGRTRRNRWNVRFRRTWTEDILMYGQDLYFIVAVSVVGFIFLVAAMVIERIFDRWKVLSRQPWLLTKNLLYY